MPCLRMMIITLLAAVYAGRRTVPGTNGNHRGDTTIGLLMRGFLIQVTSRPNAVSSTQREFVLADFGQNHIMPWDVSEQFPCRYWFIIQNGQSVASQPRNQMLPLAVIKSVEKVDDGNTIGFQLTFRDAHVSSVYHLPSNAYGQRDEWIREIAKVLQLLAGQPDSSFDSQAFMMSIEGDFVGNNATARRDSSGWFRRALYSLRHVSGFDSRTSPAGSSRERSRLVKWITPSSQLPYTVPPGVFERRHYETMDAFQTVDKAKRQASFVGPEEANLLLAAYNNFQADRSSEGFTKYIEDEYYTNAKAWYTIYHRKEGSVLRGRIEVVVEDADPKSMFMIWARLDDKMRYMDHSRYETLEEIPDTEAHGHGNIRAWQVSRPRGPLPRSYVNMCRGTFLGQLSGTLTNSSMFITRSNQYTASGDPDLIFSGYYFRRVKLKNGNPAAYFFWETVAESSLVKLIPQMIAQWFAAREAKRQLQAVHDAIEMLTEERNLTSDGAHQLAFKKAVDKEIKEQRIVAYFEEPQEPNLRT